MFRFFGTFDGFRFFATLPFSFAPHEEIDSGNLPISAKWGLFLRRYSYLCESVAKVAFALIET
jgi:hypothetical protein